MIKGRTSRGSTDVEWPVRVELVGLLPEVYKLCTKCQPLDYLEFAGINYLDEQVATYPEPVLDQQKILFDIYKALRKDFAGRVQLIPVGLMSFRGIWLCVRHRLRNPPFVIIASRRAVQGQIQYEEIKRIVQEELTNTAGSAVQQPDANR